jgi:hypothetical protein
VGILCGQNTERLSDASGVWKWMLRRVATDKPWVLVPGEQLGLIPYLSYGCCSSRPWTASKISDYTKLILQGTLRPGSLYSILN